MARRNSKEDVAKIVHDRGYKFIYENNYKNEQTRLELIDKDGYKYSVTFLSFRKQEPWKFHPSNKYAVENINLYLRKRKCNINLS